MNKKEKEYIDVVMDKVQKELSNTGDVKKDTIDRIIRQVKPYRLNRIKDYEKVQTYFNSVLYFNGEAGTEEEVRKKRELETCVEVVNRELESRRARNRELSKVDTNIITHAPYFVGGSQKRKQRGREDGYIKIEKGGVRKLRYENDTGEMLTSVDAYTLLALFNMWERQEYSEWIVFTEHQLLKTMGLEGGGKQYEIIRRSLEKLWNTSIVMYEAYDVASGKREVTKRFKLIEADRISKELSKKGDLRSKTYEIQFSKHINASIEGGYYSLISLAVYGELEVPTARGLYLMMTGIKDMDTNETYIQEDGSIKISLTEVYDTLYLESARYRNRNLVIKGCEELKSVGVVDGYSFTYKGKREDEIIITPTEWQLDVIRKNPREEVEQLTMDYID